MSRQTRRLQLAAAIPLSCVFNGVFVGTASAHVKWFCAYDVAGQPEGLENVLCPDFEFLIGLSLLALMTGAVFEGTPVGAVMLRALDRVDRALAVATTLNMSSAPLAPSSSSRSGVPAASC